MMNDSYIPKLSGFEISANTPVDRRLVLTKAQMKSLKFSDTEPFDVPDHYFAICSDDCGIYVYDVNSNESSETGKFRKISYNDLDNRLAFVPGSHISIEDIDNSIVISADSPEEFVKKITIDGCKLTIEDADGTESTFDLEPYIPTKVSDLANDLNFVSLETLQGYHDETKQDKLIAGENIEINSQNMIKSTYSYDDTEVKQLILDEQSRATEAEGDLSDMIDTREAGIKAWAEGKFLTEHQDISGKADISYVDNEIDGVKELIPDVSEYRKSSDQDIIDAKKQDKLTAGENISIIDDVISATVEACSDWSQITNKPFNEIGSGLKVESNILKADVTVPTKTSDLTNDSGFITDDSLEGLATEKYVDDAVEPKANRADLANVATSGSYNDLTNKPDIEGLASQSWVLNTFRTADDQDEIDNGKANTVHTHSTSQISGLAQVATTGLYSDLANKPSIPTIPVNISSFTNDVGYITEDDIPTNVSAFTNDVGYLTEHQDISDKVNSVVTGISGASKITNIVQMSQSAYDALTTKDTNTLYIIK